VNWTKYRHQDRLVTRQRALAEFYADYLRHYDQALEGMDANLPQQERIIAAHRAAMERV